jgi:hypothetical protein
MGKECATLIKCTLIQHIHILKSIIHGDIGSILIERHQMNFDLTGHGGKLLSGPSQRLGAHCYYSRTACHKVSCPPPSSSPSEWCTVKVHHFAERPWPSEPFIVHHAEHLLP